REIPSSTRRNGERLFDRHRRVEGETVRGRDPFQTRRTGLSRTYGSQSMSDPLRTVLVRRPDAAFGTADPKPWGYTAKPDLAAARREHDRLVDLLKQSGVDVRYHEDPQRGKADSIFVHDPAIVTDRGAVILRMGKGLRRGQDESIARTFDTLRVPILARLRGDATAEGGDLLWVNHDLLAVGQGFRTNAKGLTQIRETMKGIGVAVEAVPLPYFQGQAARPHLRSRTAMADQEPA